MRRPLALSLIVLGLVVTLIGGTGLFAPFTDTATTGVNSLTSGTRPKAADLQLAWAVASVLDCDTATYEENSTTPGHTAIDIQPGFSDGKNFCLKNVGSGLISVAITPIDLVDTDIACTGDEEAAGDTTCGGDAAGELSTVIFVQFVRLDCELGSGPVPASLGALSGAGISGLTLAPGEIMCANLEVFYPSTSPLEAVLKAQSDRVTWKYEFAATTTT